VEVSQRKVPKVPALQGKTVVSLFYEDSTRTRLSFETAARRLSADVMTFSVSTSSANKGESLRDTVETIEAMGIDAIVVRHKAAGVPQQITQWTQASVVNGGDGWHQHPTQALLDCYTIRQRLGSLAGRSIAIVGDIKHSRVARSNVDAFTALGAEVTLVAPPTLLPASLEGWPVTAVHELDKVLDKVDVVYLLRMHHEHVVAMNRGVEIGAAVPDRENTVITQQVANGVAVRMAVLYELLTDSVGTAMAQASQGAVA
jgi:aspartate carbamoyltransferase catalytic subunit